MAKPIPIIPYVVPKLIFNKGTAMTNDISWRVK